MKNAIIKPFCLLLAAILLSVLFQVPGPAARAACAVHGWIPVSMRDDWKTLYGDGVEKTE